MMYPWPDNADEQLLNRSLGIAMGYLELTGRAIAYVETQRQVAEVILSAWRTGVRHPIRLSQCGIRAIEKPKEVKVPSLYPRVS
jgi:hypothetical protein